MKSITKEDLIEVVSGLASIINTAGGMGGVDASKTKPLDYITPRWLRFNPANKKGLIIKAGTSIKKKNGVYKDYESDTQIDLSSYITDPGKDYFVILNNDNTVIASLNKINTGIVLGRFHTLCVDAGTINMTAPASPSSGLTSSDKYLVKSYSQDTDADFYNFYNKNIVSVTTYSKYDIITLNHPLSGFEAGDILPESVFCTSFCPECLIEDAMVYDKDTDMAIDIYLQSGTGFNTRSAYNANHTVNRSPLNHQEDYRMVGKKLLDDYVFTSAALGSNEKTAIYGAADATKVGGHKDTNNRRMISAIGCEEMCGYLWQWLDEIAPVGGSGWTANIDGQDSFGQHYGAPYVLLAGGFWDYSSSCGSRSRASNRVRSLVSASCGGRGSSRVKKYF